MRARCLVFICLLTGFVTNPATGQREWAFGGPDGDDWAEITELNALADATSVPGVLQSLELRPDVNITPVIYGTNHYELWQNPPNPLDTSIVMLHYCVPTDPLHTSAATLNCYITQ